MKKSQRALDVWREKGFLVLVIRMIKYVKRSSMAYFRSGIGWIYSVFLKKSGLRNKHFAESVEKLQDMGRSENIERIIETAFNFTGKGFYRNISPIQHPKELEELAREVNKADPNTAVEIGTDRGGTFYIWNQYLDLDRAISLDIDFSRISSSFLRYGNSRANFYREFNENTKIEIIEANSGKKETRNLVKSKLPSESIDFLFIDGDHSYEGVRKDFELYSSLVSTGGIIALHDIKDDRCGVPKLWEELKDDFNTKEVYYSEEIDKSLPYIEESTEETLKEKDGIGIIYK